MKQLILALFLTITSAVSFGHNYRVINRQVDGFVNSKMKELRIPGLAVAVIRDGNAVKISAYGFANIEWKNKATSHTNFQIASCTKLLTSTLLLKAMYENKIRLDDFVSEYIPASPPAWSTLQIKHLISHSSGLKDYAGDPYAATHKVVEALKDSTLEYLPGQGQHYAQLDFMLLGYILEGIYKKPFVQLLHDEVTAPLGMVDGAFDMEQRVGGFMQTSLISNKASTYYDLKGELKNYKFIYPPYTYTAGGYFASIHDMVRWAVGLDKEILFPKSFSADYICGRDTIATKISEFTRVGWAFEQEESIRYVGHSGGPGLGDIWRFPEQGYTFIVLSNDGELLPDFARAIASFYIKELPPTTDIRKFER